MISPHTKSRPLNTFDTKAMIVDAVPHVLGGIDVASSRTQNKKVRVSGAPEKPMMTRSIKQEKGQQ